MSPAPACRSHPCASWPWPSAEGTSWTKDLGSQDMEAVSSGHCCRCSAPSRCSQRPASPCLRAAAAVLCAPHKNLRAMQSRWTLTRRPTADTYLTSNLASKTSEASLPTESQISVNPECTVKSLRCHRHSSGYHTRRCLLCRYRHRRMELGKLHRYSHTYPQGIPRHLHKLAYK